ncbi:MAG TPA: serine/threonine-protein kinase [Polyangia bacterium]|jgi:serine/threonine-protein kinase|nr:serine/threonine-protein kinase [Polyangia bacterium]
MAKHGRYKIVRKVADGGMAEIFLATQIGREGFQKPVVLKRIHSTIYADPQFRNMFIDEAHISMSLSHSNIVQVLDLGLGAGRYFLVMELVDGWDLGRVLQRAAAAKMPLPREIGLYITSEVCRALSYAHGKTQFGDPLGIVHRDVSPHNILISDQGEVKLTDFGIAKAMNKREHTGTGVVKGKVAFMSPEQAMGKVIDARSDLFSVGTVLYMLMVGVRPFDAASDLETLLRVQKADFRPPDMAKTDLEPELAAIITRAMQLDPADRYQTADDMLLDVERVMRSVFSPVGQTELKRWLLALEAKDGVPSMGKAAGALQPGRTGTGEMEDVVLVDSTREQTDVGEEDTSLAVLEASGTDGRPRLSRHRSVEMDLPVPRDNESRQTRRLGPSEFSLPIPEEDGPPGRRRRRNGGRGVTILFVGVLLVVGAALAGSYLGSRAEDSRAVGPRPGEGSDNHPAVAGGADGAATAPARGESEAPTAKVATKKKTAAEPPPPAEPARELPAAREPAAARPPTAAAREPALPRSRGSSDKPEYKRRGISGLKNMMAPDPSLLPAPPAGAPGEPSPAPPPAPSEPEKAP